MPLYLFVFITLCKNKQIIKIMADEIEKKLSKDIWVGGQQPTGADREAFESLNGVPNAKTHPNTFAWYCLVSKFNPSVRDSWAGAGGKGAKESKK